jgi:hypothetical protein
VAISEGEIGAILDGSILVVTGNLRLSKLKNGFCEELQTKNNRKVFTQQPVSY